MFWVLLLRDLLKDAVRRRPEVLPPLWEETAPFMYSYTCSFFDRQKESRVLTKYALREPHQANNARRRQVQATQAYKLGTASRITSLTANWLIRVFVGFHVYAFLAPSNI